LSGVNGGDRVRGFVVSDVYGYDYRLVITGGGSVSIMCSIDDDIHCGRRMSNTKENRNSSLPLKHITSPGTQSGTLPNWKSITRATPRSINTFPRCDPMMDGFHQEQ
jgi:hypothetical protein